MFTDAEVEYLIGQPLGRPAASRKFRDARDVA
jgi:hypothetical protein